MVGELTSDIFIELRRVIKTGGSQAEEAKEKFCGCVKGIIGKMVNTISEELFLPKDVSRNYLEMGIGIAFKVFRDNWNPEKGSFKSYIWCIKPRIKEAIFEDIGRANVPFYFFQDEFKRPLTKKRLYQAIIDDAYNIPLNGTAGIILWLNTLLEVPNFYDILCLKKRNTTYSTSVIDLIKQTSTYRCKEFETLTNEEKRNIIKLNRLLLQETYPQVTPKRLTHKVTSLEGDGNEDKSEEHNTPKDYIKDRTELSPEDDYYFKELRDDLNKIFFNLPCRIQVMMLERFSSEERKLRDIAEMLGVAHTTVMRSMEKFGIEPLQKRIKIFLKEQDMEINDKNIQEVIRFFLINKEQSL